VLSGFGDESATADGDGSPATPGAGTEDEESGADRQ
jgi:hypothetical protein